MELTIDVIELQNIIESSLKSKHYDLLQLVETFEKLLENDLTAVDYLLSIGKKLLKKKENALASQLLYSIYERFKESFREENLSAYNLKLLQDAYAYAPQRKELREELVAAYRDTYSHRKNLEVYLEKSGLADDGDIQEAINQLEVFFGFDEGTYIFQEMYGFGQVVRIDAEEERFWVDFPGKLDPKTKKEIYPSKKGHMVTLRMIPKFATALADNSFKLLRHKNPETLQEMSKENPAQILKLVLKDYENRMTLKQLKAELIPDVIANAKWATWWKELKTQLSSEPYYSIGEGPAAVIEYLELARSPDDDYIARFRSGSTVSEMLELARNILANNSNIGTPFKDVVLRLCENQQKQPTLSLAAKVELFLFIKEHSEFLGVEAEGDLKEYFKDSTQAHEIIGGVEIDDYQQTLLQLYKDLHPDDYLNFFADAIFFTQRKNWDFIWKEIRKHPDIANAMINRLDASNEDYPNQYQWLAKNVFERKWEKFQVPTDIRIFENIIRILGKLSILSSNTADKRELIQIRKSLASIKSLLTYKDCHYISRYIGQANIDDVRYFDELLHTKIAVSESLRAALSKHVVRRMAKDGPVNVYVPKKVSTEEHEDQSVYVTEASLRRKQEEYDHLMKVIIPQAQIELGTAREHGDLSENAEYDAAKEKLARCDEKAQRLRNELQNARVIDFSEITGSTITVGTDVTFKNSKNPKDVVVFTLLGIWDGDEDNNIISYKTPLAQKFIGNAVGDVIEFSLHRDKQPSPYEVTDIQVTKHRGS